MTLTEQVQNLQGQKEAIEKIMSGSLSNEERIYYEDSLNVIKQRLAYFDRQAQKILEESNIGSRWRKRTFENFEKKINPTAYTTALKFAETFKTNHGTGILFFGGCGTGKTHLAVSIANYVIEKYRVPVKFGTFGSILEQVKRNFQSDRDIINELVCVPLLIIDDIGKEHKTEWTDSMLYEIINGRYEREAPVIITTNAEVDELREEIGEAIFSRLAEMCRWVRMEEHDYRKRGNK